MMKAFQEYRAIWRVTTVQRDGAAFKVLGGMALLVAFFIAVVAGVKIWRHEMTAELALRMLAGAGGLAFMLVWVMLFIPGSLVLNSAANARLMPRQRRRLMQMAAAGWLLASFAFTAVFGSVVVFPLVGMLVLGMTMAFAGYLPGIILVVLSCNWPFVSSVLLPPGLLGAMTGTTGLLVGTAVLLAGAGWGLRWLYPAGGDAHLAKRVKQLERMRRISRGDTWSQNVESGTFPGASVLRLYGAALRRDCGLGTRRADPGAMLMHALGPSVHWSIWVASMVLMLAIGVVLHVLVAWRGLAGTDAFQAGVGSGLTGFVFMIMFSTAQIGQSMTRTRGEQALLRLTPLLGDLRLMNRRLATRLLSLALLTWVGLTATVLVVSLLIAGPGVLLRQFALCCLAGQVAMTGLLGDYAGKGGWHMALVLRAGLVAALETGAAVGLGRFAGTPCWPWLAAIAILVAAWQLPRAWQSMLAAAPAFPARRLTLS